MHVSKTQANILPASTFQTMTANQQPDAANNQTGRAVNVDFDATNEEEDHRRQQTQPNKSNSAPVTVNNHQANAAENQEDRQGSLPAACAVHTATNATADHRDYGIPYDLTFGPYMNTLPTMNLEPYTGNPLLWSG